MNPDISQSYLFLIILAAVYFFVSFFAIKVGLALTVLSMLFSPEIPIMPLGFRYLVIRVEDILIPVLFMAWMARISVQKEFRMFASSPLNKPIVLLLGLMIVSTAHGIFARWVLPLTAVLYVFKTAEFFVIFFLVMNYARTEREVKQFLFFALITLTLVGIYTLFQVPHVQIFSEHRISAPFEGSPEPASVGGYMAFLLLILFGLFIYAESVLLKWVYGVVAIIVGIPFLYTLNRTSYAALIAGLLFISVIAKKKWVITVLILASLTSFIWLPEAVKDRLAFTRYDAKNPGRIFGVDQSSQERLTAFTRVWQQGFWVKSPLIGRGVTYYYSDNQYARTLSEIGIIGLVLWIWIFVRLFKISIWLFHILRDGFFKGMVLGYRAGLIGILVHAFGAPTFYIVRIMEPFWFVTGLVVALYVLKVKEDLQVGS